MANDLDHFKTNPHYAIRITPIIRVLCHDTQHSKSLLAHLQIKNNVTFYDTCKDFEVTPIDNFSPKQPDMPFYGLIAENSAEMDNVFAPFFMYLDRGEFLRNETEESITLAKFHRVSFDTWWSQDVCCDVSGKNHSRKDLIINAANKDGGAHYDEKIPKKYAHIKSQKITWTSGDNIYEFSNTALYPSIAQIGWELLMSLKVDTPS